MTIIKTSSKLLVNVVLRDLRILSRYLNQLEVDLTGKTDFIPDSKIENGFFVVDTADLIGALMGESGNKRSLSQTCNLLQIPSETCTMLETTPMSVLFFYL
jgi:hypothetical protein